MTTQDNQTVSGLQKVDHRIIDPFSIPEEKDWPVNEKRVEELMLNMRSFGFTQSLFLWEDGLRVIDGLHRAEAARRLGFREVTADIFSGSEADFWTQRVNSAINHYAVSDERLAAFISECWLSSGLYKPMTSDEIVRDYRKFGYEAQGDNLGNETLLRYSAARAVWETDFSTHRLASDKIKNKRAVDEQAKQWFIEKATMWRVDQIELKRRLLRALGFDMGDSRRVQEIDAKLYLEAAVTFAQRCAILQQVKVSKVETETVLEWTKRVENEEIQTVALEAYKPLAEIEREQQEAEKRQREEKKRQQQQQVAATPLGEHRLKQNKLDMFRRQTIAVGSMVKALGAYLREANEDYTEVGAMLLEDLNSTFAVIPGWKLQEADRLKLKVRQLEEENKRLKAQLGKQEVFVPKETVALSSGELERM